MSLLGAHAIEVVADVRRHAGSRAHPHFNPEPLALSLAGARIEYCPYPELGGRRKARADSPNTVWRNVSFRGYADYMETPEFSAGVNRLMQAGRSKGIALMCSEAVWWRCQRSLIADALKVQGVEVLHIMERGKVTEHPYTSAARIVNGRLSYAEAPTPG